ncbi:MAG: DNA polymerase I [Candidatus Latescibacteria bacterium 4484_107]|nr:MAG: DNA polymerase I [Candidatus Latescibacteria bacterium 4484_107]
MPPTKRLFLIDGSALAYRSYFAFIRNPLINSKGENTSAPFGFARALLKLIEEEKPEYIAVVFDTGKPTFRHEKYEAYKATRQKMPDEMRSSIPRIHELVRAMNIAMMELEGFEADDVIGTLAQKAAQAGMETVIVSGDKDFMQLVSPKVRLINPRKGEDAVEINEDGVRARFGVGPDRVTDVLGLMGDTSDNVPGVPGVGEKTAIALIREYGDIEGVLAHAAEVRRKNVRENLIQHADQARLSKDLVIIRTDAPVELDPDELKFTGFDPEALSTLFKELEFGRLLSEITPSEAERKAVYHTVTKETLDDLIVRIRAHRSCAVDLETTSVDAMRAEIVGISIALEPYEAFYIPVGHRAFSLLKEPDERNVPLSLTLKKLKPIIEDARIEKYGQNIKYDTTILCRAGIRPAGFVFDTMIASYVVDPSGRRHNLDALSLSYLNHKMIPISDLIGKGKKQISFAEVPIEQAAEYSGEDAEVVLRLKEKLEPELEGRGLKALFHELEMPLMEVLREMEMNGVVVDVPFLTRMSSELDEELKALVARIYEAAGEEFNVNSTRQLAHILFDKLKLPPKKKTKTGYSTDVEVLEDLAREHELPKTLLDYRQLMKLKSTYADALPKLVNPETGRIHTSFNQTVTATGRLSSSDPNFQNIPIRTEIGRKIRRAFIAGDKDWLLLDADYSQIELRIMAHLSEDATLIEAFQKDEDIHTKTAVLVFDIPPESVEPELRARAKTINFGIIYGMGPYGLARRLDIGIPEAREFIEAYFAQYPGVKAYTDRMIAEAREQGYVTTMLGRRRYLPEILSSNRQMREFAERTAVNTPVQGTSADLIKRAMIHIHRRLGAEKLRAKMILQVHDELVFEVPKEELDHVKALVVAEMEGALKLSVPVKVDVGVGANWLEAH